MRLLTAALAERTGGLDLAERLYRSCLDKDGRVADFGVRRQSEAEVYGGLLRVLNLNRKHEAIVQLCKQGLEQADATNRVMFHLDLAHALVALGKGKEALEAADAAVDAAKDSEKSKDRLVCRRSRAYLLSRMDRHKEAEAECLALLEEYKGEDEVRS